MLDTRESTFFPAEELAKTDDSIRCYSCMTKRCTNCRKEKTRSRFSPDQWHLASTESQRLCYDCNRRQCFECHKLKGQNEFNRDNWNMTDQDWARTWIDCQAGKKKRGMWMCQNKQCNHSANSSSPSKNMDRKLLVIPGNAKCFLRSVDQLIQALSTDWPQYQVKDSLTW